MLRRLSFLCALYVCLCLASLFSLSDRVQAAEEDIQVTARSTILDFPEAIEYTLNADDIDGTLKQATLNLRNNAGAPREKHIVTASDNSQSFSFQWRDDLDDDEGFFPPVGTVITYYWTVEDAEGNIYTDDTQTLRIIDNRFNWQTLEHNQYRINWYDRSEEFGVAVKDKVEVSLQKISGNLGGSLQNTIDLWVYHSREDFQTALPPDTNEWVGGIAFPSLKQTSIVVKSEDDIALDRDLPHELSHLVLGQLAAPRAVPLWMNEGLAMYNQIFHEAELTIYFEDALQDQSLHRLHTIGNDFPADEDDANLAYAQSWKLVEYMYQTYGQEKMTSLLTNLKSRTPSFDKQLIRYLGVNTAHLENNWRHSLNQPPTLSDEEAKQPIPTPEPDQQTPTPEPREEPNQPAPTPAPAEQEKPDEGNQAVSPFNLDASVIAILSSLGVVVILLGASSIIIHRRNVARQRAQLARQAQFVLDHTYGGRGPLQPPQTPVPQTPFVHFDNYTDPSAYNPPVPEQWPVPAQPYTPKSSQNQPYPPQQQPPPYYPGWPPHPSGAAGPHRPPQQPQE